MKSMSLSRVVVSRTGERLITFQQAAYLTQTSVVIYIFLVNELTK